MDEPEHRAAAFRGEFFTIAREFACRIPRLLYVPPPFITPGIPAMIRLATLLLFGAAMSLAAPAQAQLSADDIKWINQCIADNKGEPGATDAIVRKYCMCMNEKMDDSETLSITQWEKKNPSARRACDREAGWR
jgi:hypothetical protein